MQQDKQNFVNGKQTNEVNGFPRFKIYLISALVLIVLLIITTGLTFFLRLKVFGDDLGILLGLELACFVIFLIFMHFSITYFFDNPLTEIKKIADEIVDGNLDFEINEEMADGFAGLRQYLKKIQDTLKIQRDQIGSYFQVIGEVNKDLSNKVESLSLLADANAILSKSLDLEEKLKDFISILQDKTPFSRVVVYFFDKDTGGFTCFNPEFSAELPLKLNPGEEVSEIFCKKSLQNMEDTGLRSFFSNVDLPYIIRVGTEFNQLGLVFMNSSREINETDIYTLEILCGTAASSIYNSLLYKNTETTKNQLDQKVFNLMSIHQSGKILSSTLDTEKLIQLSLDIFLETIWANKGVLLLVNEESGLLQVKSYKGLTNEEIEEQLADPQEIKIMKRLCDEMVPLICGEFVSGSFSYSSYKQIENGKFSLYIPLLKEDKIYGAYMVGSKINDQPFSENDLEFLVTLSSQVVISFENARLYSLAITDGMTMLYLHRYFQLRLDEEISRGLRYKTPVSLLMMDIDKFKSINDNFGHQQGDIILIQVAKIIKRSIRQTDIAARYGGEEFCLILPESCREDARVVAERIRQGVEDCEFPDLNGKPSLRVTISIGISTLPFNALTKENLIQKADSALYDAKEGGRNQVVINYLGDDEGMKMEWGGPKSNSPRVNDKSGDQNPGEG
ncbi:diguanylate cyclase [Candidatus Riflebacteria bacterium]